MKQSVVLYLIVALLASPMLVLNAGNPDRKGEAGAYELLINPWARPGGLNGLNTSRVQGIEAMRFNAAGLAFVRKTEVLFSHTRWIVGTDVSINAAGIAQKVGEGNVLGLSIMSVDVGDLIRTTTDNPEGIGTFKPRFLNMGLSFAKAFSNSIYAGAVVRVINEGIADVSATGVALDAGLQYVTGKRDNARFGVSLRNVGTPMRFNGDGLTFRGEAPSGEYNQTLKQRSEKFELPSLLHIGASYDFYLDEQATAEEEIPDLRLTVVANFTSNSFGKDQYGGGLEFGYKEYFALRAGYRYEQDITNADERTTVYTGIAAGVSVNIPIKKDGPSFGLDYAYQHTDQFSGTHLIGARFNL